MLKKCKDTDNAKIADNTKNAEPLINLDVNILILRLV
jgi:hypothetical protein